MMRIFVENIRPSLREVFSSIIAVDATICRTTFVPFFVLLMPVTRYVVMSSINTMRFFVVAFYFRKHYDTLVGWKPSSWNPEDVMPPLGSSILVLLRRGKKRAVFLLPRNTYIVVQKPSWFFTSFVQMNSVYKTMWIYPHRFTNK